MPEQNIYNHKGTALIICAPSGTGKTTLIHRLRKEFPQLQFSISCTTRPPRKNEIHGTDYYFISEEEFFTYRANKKFAEWALVHGHFYGTPLTPILTMLNSGQNVVFDIDIQGAAQLYLTIPEGKYVLLLPPTLKELEKRLHKRGSDDTKTIQTRLAKAVQELHQGHWFDAWIVNDNLDTAYDELRSIFIAATLSPKKRPQLIQSVIEGWS